MADQRGRRLKIDVTFSPEMKEACTAPKELGYAEKKEKSKGKKGSKGTAEEQVKFDDYFFVTSGF